jgi:hypothetical protein
MGARRRRRDACRTTWIRIGTTVFVRIIIVILGGYSLNEMGFYLVLPSSSQHMLQSNHNHNHTIAIVTYHGGYKFSGYRGQWLNQNKQSYAKKHGYEYWNEQFLNTIPERALEPLDPWQSSDPHRKYMYNKLRFLLFLLTNHPEQLQWILWVDCDTIFTNDNITIPQRIEDIRVTRRKKLGQRQSQPSSSSSSSSFLPCLIWSADAMSANAGVLLLPNTESSRDLLRQSLHENWKKDDAFLDQMALIRTTRQMKCDWLLLQHGNPENDGRDDCEARLLQSRVRGTKIGLFRSGDWILHLPNHNRYQMAQSIPDAFQNKFK